MLAICCAVSSPPAAIFSFILLSHKEEAFHLRVAAEQLQAQRPCGAQQQPCRRDNGDPDIFGALHLDQHHGAKHQRHGGQHLVRDTEQRPQALHAAQRVDHALIQQVAPQPDAAGGTDNPGDQRVGFSGTARSYPTDPAA